MRIGTTLPQFQPDAERGLAIAQGAEASGLDGVFVFDHLWPLGRPEGDFIAMVPLLAAVAAETRKVRVGSLVARIGIVPDALLIHQLASTDLISGGRVIAGLGTGDKLSAAENLAFGVAYPPVAERLASLEHCATLARDRGLEVWLGGRTPAVREVAIRTGAAVNLWAAAPGEVDAALTAGAAQVTWGGQILIGRDENEIDVKRGRLGLRPGLVHGTVDQVADRLRTIHRAGATWAVCAPLDIGQPGSVETLALVAERLR
jgi:alkanesulfonate monooxygenase SsuD/methylene tetrahydromethanopterin reductase-like flavin-dependent oxidoreductase (luciferase family)